MKTIIITILAMFCLNSMALMAEKRDQWMYNPEHESKIETFRSEIQELEKSVNKVREIMQIECERMTTENFLEKERNKSSDLRNAFRDFVEFISFGSIPNHKMPLAQGEIAEPSENYNMVFRIRFTDVPGNDEAYSRDILDCRNAYGFGVVGK